MDQSLAAAFDVDVIGGLSRLAGSALGGSAGKSPGAYLSRARLSLVRLAGRAHLAARRIDPSPNGKTLPPDTIVASCGQTKQASPGLEFGHHFTSCLRTLPYNVLEFKRRNLKFLLLKLLSLNRHGEWTLAAILHSR